MWSKGDVMRLRRRVGRMTPRPSVDREACEQCQAGNHHGARWQGGYLICRCLRCPVLVVREGK